MSPPLLTKVRFSKILEKGTRQLLLDPLVHMSRTYSAYCHLASKLLEVDSGIADLRGVVTDGEAGLIRAMKAFYPQTAQLRCSRNFRETAKTN